jgi:hypothetical protein
VTGAFANGHASLPYGDNDTVGGAISGAVVDDFDVVAVGIEQERRIVSGMIIPLAWSPNVRSAGGKARFVKPVDRSTVTGLKRQVNATGKFAGGRFAVRRTDRQFVGPEETLAAVHDGNA